MARLRASSASVARKIVPIRFQRDGEICTHVGFMSFTTFLASRRPHGFALPHPRSDLLFFRPHHVRVDGRGLDVGMAKPSLDEIEGYAGLNCAHAKSVAEALGACVTATNASCLHDLAYSPVAGHPRPWPKQVCCVATYLAQAMKCFEVVGRERNGAEDAFPALFEASDDDMSSLEIDILACER